ncbi:hypothetical protein [Rhodovulum marinum]|uniref:Lipoprotein n=1 Tax=Rhodovulum marinum TaxID=320662 RepID=A0A4R2Q7Q7_9RHOB|nr:hypothetical protein [Rhodovulum marinum]TCP43948.1 hypothetical protein EV662_10132 [Rhodovulum marinum]
MRPVYAFALAGLAGCVQFAEIEQSSPVKPSPTLVSEIKAEVTRDFLDPNSAQFRNLRVVDVTLANGQHERRVCGEVNGKNAMGGYVGFSMFGGVVVDGDFRQRDFFSPCEQWRG